MKTLESIIESKIKSHIEDIPLCNDVIVAGTENPELYDSIVRSASNIAEDIISINFKYILNAACNSQEEPESPDEEVEVDTNISEEDKEMLQFIAG